MLKIKQELFFDERLTFNKKVGHFVPQKRKLNQGKNPRGRVPKGNDKYQLIIQKPVLVEYKDGTIKKETRVLNWKTISRFVRDRDGQCLKCGRKNKLEADHFHPNSYKYINWFFRPSKIQTLCVQCHTSLPSMGGKRGKNWREYVWLK